MVQHILYILNSTSFNISIINFYLSLPLITFIRQLAVDMHSAFQLHFCVCFSRRWDADGKTKSHSKTIFLVVSWPFQSPLNSFFGIKLHTTCLSSNIYNTLFNKYNSYIQSVIYLSITSVSITLLLTYKLVFTHSQNAEFWPYSWFIVDIFIHISTSFFSN